MQDLRGMLTPAQAASRVGVSTHSVYRWLRNGTLKGLKVGGSRYFISPKDLADVVRPAAGG